MNRQSIKPAEDIRPVRWLVVAYLSGLLLPVVLGILRVHTGVKILLVLFGLPAALIGSYCYITIRRVFFYPDALADLSDRRLFLVFVMPPALYMLIVAGKFTLLLIAFALSFL